MKYTSLMSMRRFTSLTVVMTVLALVTWAEARPRLGVVIVVDQLCADQLTRYSTLFTGGIARLQNEGVGFAEAHHEHANAFTAVGHASIATGCNPNHHGIVGNDWYDRATGVRLNCCDDSTAPITNNPAGKGRSPRLLETSTISDWLKSRYPSSRVVALSQKDRGGILTAGRNADGVYWIDDDVKGFVTSSYYRDTLPEWLVRFNHDNIDTANLPSEWTKGWPEATYALASVDSVAAENDGVHIAFPHVYDSAHMPGLTHWDWFLETPYSDELPLRLARAAVSFEQLGADTIPDLLWVCCGGTDYIGHSYGPTSQEVLDQLLHLDANLGGFFAFLDSTMGAGYTVVLSSDHGVMPFPEELTSQGIAAERIPSSEMKLAVNRAAKTVADALGAASPLIKSHLGNAIMLDTTVAVELGIKVSDFRQSVADEVRKVHGIAEVMTLDDLSEPSAAGHGYRARYRLSYSRERSPDIVYRVEENTLVIGSAYGTTHGTPYRYDTHVPLIFWGAGVDQKAVTVSEPVRTIDIAPTMAALLGLDAPFGVDGTVLHQVIGGSGR